jgi:hypothetical protein
VGSGAHAGKSFVWISDDLMCGLKLRAGFQIFCLFWCSCWESHSLGAFSAMGSSHTFKPYRIKTEENQKLGLQELRQSHGV